MPIKFEHSFSIRAKNDYCGITPLNNGEGVHVGAISLDFSEVQEFADALVLVADKIRLANLSQVMPSTPKE